MPLRDFWISVKTAARLLSFVVEADSPKVDKKRIESIMRRADLWLSPGAVDGFEETDFTFLANEERELIVKYVQQFQKIAAAVPSDGPADPEQAADARQALFGILDILRFDRFSDPESLRLGKLVEQRIRPRLPQWVHDLTFQSGNDASGDPALWVWVEVDDEAANRKDFSDIAKQVREQIAQAVRSVDNRFWPYIRFRTVSEQASVEKRAQK